jgi:hypothetical protein
MTSVFHNRSVVPHAGPLVPMRRQLNGAALRYAYGERSMRSQPGRKAHAQRGGLRDQNAKHARRAWPLHHWLQDFDGSGYECVRVRGSASIGRCGRVEFDSRSPRTFSENHRDPQEKTAETHEMSCKHFGAGGRTLQFRWGLPDYSPRLQVGCFRRKKRVGPRAGLQTTNAKERAQRASTGYSLRCNERSADGLMGELLIPPLQ